MTRRSGVVNAVKRVGGMALPLEGDRPWVAGDLASDRDTIRLVRLAVASQQEPCMAVHTPDH